MPPLHRHRKSVHWKGALVGALAGLSACAVNPDTGERQFTGLLPASQEAAVGAQEHPRILEQFGGPYPDPQLQSFVDGLGRRLAAQVERRDIDWTFTVLDTDTVNAFALPGGYVYITRGLIALAEDEAEVASVLAHEIAHVAARHSAERVGQSTLAGLITAGLGLVVGNPQLAQALNLGAGLVLARYSREQELEADALGTRYLAQAGYDPIAMAGFLETMRRYDQYQAARAGGEAAGYSFFATHPPTGDRVERAVELARQYPPRDWSRPADPYFAAVDGMLFGDNPEQGFVRGQQFIHPAMGFRFAVPPGFSLTNGATQVVAEGPDGSAVIFDAGSGGGDDMVRYLTQGWASGVPVAQVQSFQVNGRPAATGLVPGQTQRGPADVRLVAIRGRGDRVYRFTFAAPPGGLGRVDAAFRSITNSFELLSEAEAGRYQPRRLRVMTAGPGDSVARYVAMMPREPYAEELFRIINDLPPGEELRPGRKVKVVS